MRGSTIKKLGLLFKLILISTFFVIVPERISDTKFSIYYYILLFLTSSITYWWCQNVIDIRKQNKLHNNKTMKTIQNIELIEDKDFPIFYELGQEKYYYFAKEKIMKLNNDQLKEFEAHGYVIMIGTYEKLKSFYKPKTACGLFSKVDKYIILFTDIYLDGEMFPTDNNSFERTLYHEWGHFVDFLNDFESSKIKFILHYLGEKDMINFSVRFLYNKSPILFMKNNPMINLHEYSNSTEYFANNYSKYKRNCLDDIFLINVFDRIENKN